MSKSLLDNIVPREWTLIETENVQKQEEQAWRSRGCEVNGGDGSPKNNEWDGREFLLLAPTDSASHATDTQILSAIQSLALALTDLPFLLAASTDRHGEQLRVGIVEEARLVLPARRRGVVVRMRIPSSILVSCVD